MKGEGLLRAVCILLIAAGASSCRFGEEGAKSAWSSEESLPTLDVRRSPLSNASEESGAGRSDPVGICDPDASPVVIVVVESPQKVQSASALWRATPILVREAETVVFADGRIVTSRLDATGDHLQSLGWTHRDIEIVGGLPAAAGAWQRRRG